MKAIPELYRNYMAKSDETLHEHTCELLVKLDELKELISEESIVKGDKGNILNLIEIACIYHDLGKINPLFQTRIRKSIENGKRVRFDATKEIGHNILSAYLFTLFEDEYELNKEDKLIVLNAILNHHSYVKNNEVVDGEDFKDLIIDNLQRITEALTTDKNAQDLYKSMGGRTINWIKKIGNNPTAKSILVKGFLHKCDYAASAHAKVEICNYNIDERLENLGYEWNAMQNFARENKQKNMILVGSTGLGKTEASLLWIGNNKGFYVLPLKTAINAMYQRLRYNLYREDYTDNLGLLHGDTKSVYISNTKSNVLESSDKLWEYYQTTKLRALPLTVTTPDQIFRFVFKYPAYELELATYSYSKIIIDEIQAYSPDILAALIYGLQQINNVGGKFAITTATLPPFIKDLLEEDSENEIRYQEAMFLNPVVRHRVKIKDTELYIQDIVEFATEKRGLESSKILVVVNTIKLAQTIYEELVNESNSEFLEEYEINLLHSKFIVKDRNEKEEAILKDGELKCKKKVIWVATQVIEASLDIDFDYIFTELSDLSGLFQRLGRCNRNGKKSIDEFNCFVYTKISEKSFRKNASKNNNVKTGFIYKSLFELSKRALVEWENSTSTGEMAEEDKQDLINSYLTMGEIKNYDRDNKSQYISYLVEYRAVYDHLKTITPESLTFTDAQHEFRNIISFKAIPEEVYNQYYTEINDLISMIEKGLEELFGLKNVEARREIQKNILHYKNELNQFTMSIDAWNSIDWENPFLIDKEKIYKSKDSYNSRVGLKKKTTNTGNYSEGIFV